MNSKTLTLALSLPAALLLKPADLVSGALLARLASASAETACRRQIETGRQGLQMSDLLTATDNLFKQASRLLTPGNRRAYLEGLPQDDDVVGVDLIRPRVERSHRYLHVN